jgi:hypothetical protein
MRSTAALALALLGAAPSGCGAKHIRDCEGGLEIQVFVPIDDLDDAEELYVLVGIDESPDQFWEHTWSADELDDNGFGDLVLRIPVEEPTRLTIIGQLRGPGDTVLASASVPFIIQPLDSGCQPVTLGMGGAGRDGSVVDAEDLVDAEVPADACSGNCPADAGGPPDSVENMDGSPGDFDGDLIPDQDDNCMFVYNPDQNDEEDDGVGDRCDNCPIDANDDQADTDPDTIGDACDPHLNDPDYTDYLQWMDGFGGPAGTVSGYIINGTATWNVSGGKVSNNTASGSHALQVPTGGPTFGIEELRVYTQATVTALAGGAGNKGAGLTIKTNGDLASGWRCLGRANTDILAIDDLTFNTTVGSATPFTIDPGTTSPIYFEAYPNQFAGGTNTNCTYQIETFALNDAAVPNSGSSFGLTASGATVQFDYLFAILSVKDNISPPLDGGGTGGQL